MGPRDPHWSVGIVPFENAVVLLVTLEKGDSEYLYEDRFEENLFWWQSQTRHSQDTAIIQRIALGSDPILLFVRVAAKRKNTTCPFAYCGRLANPAIEGAHPVTFLFESVDYSPFADGDLKEIYAWRPGFLPAPTEARREEVLREKGPRKQRGQGRQSDPMTRIAVEAHAMAAAKNYYEAAGYALTDTSANRPYDYVAKKGDQKRRIEVKGTQGDASSVTVTAGEVNAALSGSELTDLFVLYAIEVDRREGSINVSGGKARVVSPWAPGNGELVPTEFRYKLPPSP